MSLFLRHITRSARRAPLQPLLITLTVILAVALAVMAFAVSGMFARHAQETAQNATAAGDILISMRADSGARILFEEDAAALLGEDGRVLGEFRLTGTLGGEAGESAVTVSCTDLLAADDFYRFSYTVYGSFHEKTLDRTAILSTRAAREHSLSVGDSFTLRLLEQDFTYTIGAIAADEGLLTQSDVLVSIDGIVATLAERMPIIASLGDSFRPYTRLMVKLSDTADAGALMERFSASSAFADKQVSFTQNDTYGDFWIMVQLAFLWITLLLVLILAAFVIGTSLTLLHRRRAGEYALFALTGAAPAQLRGLILLESALYALVGGLGGVLLGIPVTRVVGYFYDWQTEPLVPGLPDAFFGFFFGFLLMLLCTLLYLGRAQLSRVSRETAESEEIRERLLPTDWLPATVALALALLMLPALPVRIRFVACIVAVLALVWLLFALTPWGLRLMAGGAARALARTRRPAAPLWLALKNLSGRFSVRHAGRMLAVMLALLLALFTCERVLSDQVEIMTVEAAEGLVGYGVSSETELTLSLDPCVKGVMRMDFRTGATVCGKASAGAMSLTGDIAACVEDAPLPSRMPQGDEVVLAKGLAELIGAGVGDAIDCVIGGVPCTLTVVEILRCNSNLLYYDADALGIRRDVLCVVFDQSDPANAERLIAAMEADGATVSRNSSLFGSVPNIMSGHVRFLRLALLLSLLLCLLGVANMLAQQHYVRVRERELLRLCGMTRKSVFTVQLLEVACLVLAAGLLALLVGGSICLLIDVGLRSFGMLLFV